MKFDCEITNATIVDPRGRYRGTISISGEKVAGILAEPSGYAARTIDAEGLVALPGMVDQHVHFMDPGENSREDFIYGSSAAAVGGGDHCGGAHSQQPGPHRRKPPGEARILEG